jgi:protocatechuate 3,4-dioxygenase beta subunit
MTEITAMRYHLLFVALLLTFSACTQKNSGRQKNQLVSKNDLKVGGSCEGCEAIYESPISFEKLGYIDTLPDFREKGPRIEISGTIYQRDGKTPAPNVVLYIYHTDQSGKYSNKGNESGWGKRHGYIRGWLKTNQQGQYKFYTLIPAAYPGGNNPKHIHPVIKEAGKTEYWIDEYLFDDDPLLTSKERDRANPVGGNGIIKPVLKDGIFHATRDIILGLNVADYPKP